MPDNIEIFEDSGFTDPIAGDMVAVKGGTFMMGGTEEQGKDCFDDEKHVHSVTLSDYYIGKYPVTQRLWKRVMAGTPLANQSEFKGDDLPVEMVSWEEVVEKFLPRLNALTGKVYQLPTEAEWEYAARGGTKSKQYKYAGSNNIDEVAWYEKNSRKKTHPVGTKKPNELGIYDMSGNVFEWVNDWMDDVEELDGYYSDLQINPIGPSWGTVHVCRGGSWYCGAVNCRVSARASNDTNVRGYGHGVRLVLSSRTDVTNVDADYGGSGRLELPFH